MVVLIGSAIYTGAKFDDGGSMMGTPIEFHRTAVLLYQIPGDNNLGKPTSEVQQEVFGSQYESFASFLKEASYGRIRLVGKVSDWRLIQATGDATIQQVISAADDQLDYTKYDRLILIRPRANGVLGSGSGQWQTYQTQEGDRNFMIVKAYFNPNHGYPDFSRATLLATGFQPNTGYHLISHEYGHALVEGITLAHPAVLGCGTQTLVFNGNALDPSCIYGVEATDQLGTGAGHYNSVIKEKLGWFKDGMVVDAVNAGVYTINEYESTEGVKLVRVPRFDCSGQTDKHPCGGDDYGYYYLEYRQPHLHDAGLFKPPNSPAGSGFDYNGLEIRMDGYNAQFSSVLLDMNRQSSLIHVLQPGKSWFMPQANRTITVLDLNETSLRFFVD